MILIDTSAWIDFFRGDGPLADQVAEYLTSNQALLCEPVLTELHRGLSVEAQQKQVFDLLQGCRTLPQPDNLWLEAGVLGTLLRKKGVSAKTLDLLIAHYALSHGVALLTGDRDFFYMHAAGLPLHLA